MDRTDAVPRMAVAMKERVLIVGLPRSGTTVLANYINSLERAFCFLEPHWEYKRTHSTRFFRDPKLRWLFFLRFREHDPLPLDDAVRRIQRRYELVGIKETFRGEHFARYDPDVPNESLLAAYVDAGYRLIPILRHPLHVWNSWRGFFVPEDGWGLDLDDYLENYERLCAFAGDTQPLIYERFIEDPPRELSRSGISSEGFAGRLHKRKTVMGDPVAKRSVEVQRMERPVRYTEAEQRILESSAAMRSYETALGRSAGA